MRVDFMIIGAQKSGTTTLFNILNSHPMMVGSNPKEPHFFSTSKDWQAQLSEYEKNYNRKQGAMYFEGSTTYTFFPLRNLRIWDDLYQYNPDIKLIYIVRNPIDRIISGYMHTYERGYTDLSIEQAIKNDRLYLDITRYYTQIKPYIEKFGSQQVKIIDFDDMANNRTAVIEDLSAFLGFDIDGISDIENTRSNVSINGGKSHYKYDKLSFSQKVIRKFFPVIWEKITDNSKRGFTKKPELSPEYREMILKMLDLEITQLEKLMGKDLSKWRMPN